VRCLGLPSKDSVFLGIFGDSPRPPTVEEGEEKLSGDTQSPRSHRGAGEGA